MNSRKLIFIIATIAIVDVVFGNGGTETELEKQCLDELKNGGQFKLNGTTAEALNNAIYTNIDNRHTSAFQSSYKILFSYWEHLEKSAKEKIDKVQNPFLFCVANIIIKSRRSKEEKQEAYKGQNVKEKFLNPLSIEKENQDACNELLEKNPDFNDAVSSLHYTIFRNLSPCLIKIFLEYCKYIAKVLIPLMGETSAKNPRSFCKTYLPGQTSNSAAVPLQTQDIMLTLAGGNETGQTSNSASVPKETQAIMLTNAGDNGTGQIFDNDSKSLKTIQFLLTKKEEEEEEEKNKDNKKKKLKVT